jgi:hypothetical protein
MQMSKKNAHKYYARFRLDGDDASLFEALKYPQAGVSVALRLLLFSDSAWAFFDDVDGLRELLPIQTQGIGLGNSTVSTSSQRKVTTQAKSIEAVSQKDTPKKEIDFISEPKKVHSLRTAEKAEESNLSEEHMDGSKEIPLSDDSVVVVNGWS